MEGRRAGRKRAVLSVGQRIQWVAWRRATGYGAPRMERLMREGTPWWPGGWPVIAHNRINDVFREAGLLREGKTRGKKPTYVRF